MFGHHVESLLCGRQNAECWGWAQLELQLWMDKALSLLSGSFHRGDSQMTENDW